MLRVGRRPVFSMILANSEVFGLVLLYGEVMFKLCAAACSIDSNVYYRRRRHGL